MSRGSGYGRGGGRSGRKETDGREPSDAAEKDSNQLSNREQKRIKRKRERKQRRDRARKIKREIEKNGRLGGRSVRRRLERSRRVGRAIQSLPHPRRKGTKQETKNGGIAQRPVAGPVAGLVDIGFDKRANVASGGVFSSRHGGDTKDRGLGLSREIQTLERSMDTSRR
ncbi:predicted protein [Histoplasma capsulatum var. duboisii H88]|uniref:Predicted protein n=1 Tax=Ajellomyces capsulatus (strain H88) TaxID=544711 RepID=F0UFP5_AJEC8|nr:predicted protein [Histoplasma capsulatum var. duboisii H88]